MRRSFVVGIEGARPQDDTELGGEPDRPPLTFASACAAELHSRLGSFGYAVVEADEPPGRDPAVLEQALEAVLRGPGTVVVHLLAHGEKHRHTGKLHLVADNGELTKGHVETWLEAVYLAPEDERPTVLFVLDICHAGVATLPLWSQRLSALDRRAWVIAACGAEATELAYDGRLTRALTEVLHRYANDWLRVDEWLPYIPFQRICREVGALVSEYSKVSTPQQVRSTAVELHEQHIADRLEFFPNPRYGHREIAESLHALSNPALRPVVDEILDVDHFLLRLTDRADIVEAARANSYQGRSGELRLLSGWLAAGESAVQIVTGRAGAGKSALLSVLVCAAHEMLREPTKPLWEHLPRVPGVVADLAVIHARHGGIKEIAHSIARQWGLQVPVDWAADRLVDLVRQRFPVDPPRLIVDALDEGERPADIDAVVLRPLMTAIRPDGRPLCRVLVGAREHPDLAPLFAQARSEWSVLDLDDVKPAVLHDDLRRYVREALLATPDYGNPAQEPVVMALADGIAAALTAEEAVLPWGEFLVAGLYVRALLRQPALTSASQAGEIGRAVPRDLRALVALDVARRGVHPWVGPVLSTLAFAEGTGLPEELIQAVAGAFGDSEPGREEIRRALEAAKYYLRQDVGPDGSTVYRLFHQGLVDRLREEPLVQTLLGRQR
jgi:hypothetical protein